MVWNENWLTIKQCFLSIPPSAAKGNQMTTGDIKKISNIGNVKIFTKQATKIMKEFHVLKTKQPILFSPVFNDIMRLVAALVNLQKPIAK